MASAQRLPRDIPFEADAEYQRLAEQHRQYEAELQKISRSRNPFGAWGGGVSRRWPRGRRYRGRERGKAGKAREHFPGGVERTREPVARHGNDCEAGIPARKISGGHAGTGFYGK